MDNKINILSLLSKTEVKSNGFLLTKKEIQKSSKDFANKIIEDGEHNLYEVFAQSVRLEEALKVIKNELKNKLPDESFESFGIKATYRNGGDSINYDDDSIYADLKSKLKDRENLLKTALKSKETIYDSEGIEVPKVSTTPRKSSLSISF